MAYAFQFGAMVDDPDGAGSVDFSTFGLMVTADRSKLWLPIGVQVVEASYSPVAAAYGPTYSPKHIVLECKVTGDDESDRQDKLDSIIYNLVTNADRALWLDHQTGRFYMARLVEASDPEWVGKQAVRLTLTFVARDGRAYSDTLTTQTTNLTGTGGSWNVGASAAVGGSIFNNPMWTIKSMGSGSASGVTLSNVTRNETLVVSGAFTSGEWIRIDSTPDIMLVEKSVDSGANWTNIMPRVSGVFPCLSPGVQNAMTVSGFVNTGTVVATYRERYQ